MQWSEKHNVDPYSFPPRGRADEGIAAEHTGYRRPFDLPTTSLSEKPHGDEPTA